MNFIDSHGNKIGDERGGNHRHSERVDMKKQTNYNMEKPIGKEIPVT